MNSKPNTIITLFVISFAIMLVGGLVVVPAAVEQADAKCDSFKKNGDQCKDKGPKDRG